MGAEFTLVRFVLAVAVLGGFGGAVAHAQPTVVSQYQYTLGTSDSNLTSDWFSIINTGTPVVAPGNIYLAQGGSYSSAQFYTGTYSNVAQVGTIYNYTSKSPISNASPLVTGDVNFGTGPTPPATTAGIVAANSWVAGGGMNYIAQNAGTSFDTNVGSTGANFRIRNGNRQLNLEGSGGGNQSSGITFLGYAASLDSSGNPSPIQLNDPSLTYQFALSLGVSGTSTTLYQNGFRAAIQDALGQWYLSAWETGAYTGTPLAPSTLNMVTGEWAAYPNDGSTPTGTDPGWAPYTPADLTSASMAYFDPNTATFGPFTGTAQAFGFWFGENLPNIAFRANGFQVTTAAVPEPGAFSLTVLGLGGIALAKRLKRRG